MLTENGVVDSLKTFTTIPRILLLFAGCSALTGLKFLVVDAVIVALLGLRLYVRDIAHRLLSGFW